MQKLSKTTLILAVSAVLALNIHVLDPNAENPADPEEQISGLLTVERNSLVANSPLPELRVVKKVTVIVTAYSSTPWETWGDPFVTAAGTQVRDGIIANNLLPFGTKVRLPEIYGDKIFVVEDRMNSRKGNYHFDIWFSTHWDAKNFGAKNTYIEILEN